MTGESRGRGAASLGSQERKPERRGRWPFLGMMSTSPNRQAAGRREHLERKAGWLLQAADLAVQATDKGDPRGRLGGEVEVVINQLAPLHEQERTLLVLGQLLRGEAHDGVGDGASLRDADVRGCPAAAWARPRLPRRPVLTRGTGKPPRLAPRVQP